MQNDIKALADAVLAELVSRIDGGQDNQLGWCEPSDSNTYVYAARAADGSPWYAGHKDENGDFIQVPTSSSIKGTIAAFYPYEVNSDKYGKSWKLRLILDCGKAGRFHLTAGTQSVAGHNLIMGIADLKERLLEPIMITPIASEQDPKVLFLNITAGGEQIPTHWDKVAAADQNYWRQQMAAAIENVRVTLGNDAVTPPQRKEPEPVSEPNPEPTQYENPPF